ncbi:MAG: ferredoxin, partial [Metallosphaera sp.]
MSSLSFEYQFFPVSHPAEGAGGKTGNWRVVKP